MLPNPLVRTVDADDFTPQPGAGIPSFDAAINAILGGNTYMNVHTQANPDGVVRGPGGP